MKSFSQSSPPAPATRRAARRRVISCETCRRAKTRCDLSPKASSCNRCQKLRIKCSLSSSDLFSHGNGHDEAVNVGERQSLEKRIANIEDSLQEMKSTLASMCCFMQNLDNRPMDNVVMTEASSSTAKNHATGQHADFPHLPSLRTETTKLAPIMMVRKFRPDSRRLYRDPGNDIVEKRILSEEVATCLVSEFLNHRGSVIQIEKSPTDGHLRHRSPLLFAVCALHGLRFSNSYDTLLNSPTHRHLYEEVRDMLGQAVLASPLPLDELYAILIMSTFEAAPRPVYEYIESWLLSGICAKQAILSIDFPRINQRIDSGNAERKDKQLMSLWNNICLINFRFAVGTGKPTTIPANYIDQCPAILNHPEASVEDDLVLAEILLYRTLHNKLANFSLGDDHGEEDHCTELRTWENKWKRLLDSPQAITLRFSYDIAQMVIARRATEDSIFSGTTASQLRKRKRNNPRKVHEKTNYHILAYQSALSVAERFIHASVTGVQALPKFHHICIAYCALVLSETACEHNAVTSRVMEGISARDVLLMLKRIRQHYHMSFGGEIPEAMNVAVARVAAVVSDTTDSAGYASQGINYNDSSLSGNLPTIGIHDGTENQYVRRFPGGNELMDMNDFDHATLDENFLVQDLLFDGSNMSFVDYFNSTW